MSKQISNSVRVQGAVEARMFTAREKSFTRSSAAKLAFPGLSAGLLSMLLAPGSAMGQPNRLPDPSDPPISVPSARVSIADNGMLEGSRGSALLKFKVTVVPTSARPITLRYKTSDRSACCSNHDYQDCNNELVIPANASSAEIAVPVFGDTDFELDENFNVVLTGAFNADIDRAVATGTIIDDDRLGGSGGPRHLPPDVVKPGLGVQTGIVPDPIDPLPNVPSPRVSIADNAMLEGSSGSAVLKFKVSVAPTSDRPITLTYKTSDRSACCTNHDYQDCASQLVIPANASSAEIEVPVFGDNDLEFDENFSVVLVGASNANIGRGVATGTILNDDSMGGSGGPRKMPETDILPDPADPPSPWVPSAMVSVEDNGIVEGSGGSAVLKFRVTVVPVSDQAIVLTYKTADRSACCSDHDYLDCGGQLVIPAHASSAEIAVPVYGDDKLEFDETFSLVLTGASTANIARGVATGTIFNDDRIGGSGGPRQMPEYKFEVASGNPVHGRPTFRFALQRPSNVSIALFDLAGRMIGTPVEGFFQSGTHLQAWNQLRPAPGVYLARFRADGKTATQRITWMN